MPLYEFDCEECQQPFEKLVRSSTAMNEITCPICGSDQVTKKLSAFATHSNSAGSYSGTSAACSPVGT